MTRLGIAFSGGPSPAEIVDCIKLAEELGYESAWVAEGHGGDQFAVLAACATRTSRILLGTSISSVFVRTAPTIAMAASTVAELTGGRFILGLGSSHKVQVEPEHGVAYGKPLTSISFCNTSRASKRSTRKSASMAVRGDFSRSCRAWALNATSCL